MNQHRSEFEFLNIKQAKKCRKNKKQMFEQQDIRMRSSSVDDRIEQLF